MTSLLRLRPGETVRLPDTNLEVRWDGDVEVTVRRRCEIWNLAPLTEHGRVLAYVRLARHPDLRWWPLVPLSARRDAIIRGAVVPSGARE